MKKNIKSILTEQKWLLIAGLTILAMLALFAYLMVRTLFFIFADYYWYEKALAFALLMAEVFILVHGFGYFLNLLQVITKGKGKTAPAEIAELESYPPVAIIVSSYKEPLDVIEDTLTCFYNLTYPNRHLYFLDDTRYELDWDTPEKKNEYRRSVDAICKNLGINLFRRKWHGAKAGMINDFLAFVEGEKREGFEFSAFSNKKKNVKEKYIIVFDADMNPFPDFVEPLVSLMEKDEKIAFIQTPQYYTNFEHNRIARAAGLQQAVFYEYICEGKSMKDAMFCCGTNVVFRREALMDVGGFDESSVTEDFATSLKFHSRGWRSFYFNHVCAFGMGPEDVGGYFKQQFRWALGTVGLFRTILIEFFKNPSKLSVSKWWEYFLSGTHYFVGWVVFVMILCPVLYLFTKVPSYFAKPEIYIFFFTPYIVITFALFFWTLKERKYKPADILFGVFLSAVSFPVYMKASLLAILGFKGTFGITPKGGSASLPFFSLWPQILASIICFGAIVWGINRLYYEQEPFYAILVNSFWCLYYFIILSFTLYFNEPEE